ncbi:restriction endonuclease [Staphylococcus simulans]|uniref:restriction endonuclease n=1 Tax=Staphylococcus simulans TaxID=1286 RepID=UPI0021D046B0|nr:restriction endonuclease [Staphylococcus simulans]UXR38019.1 restriction endonuclease [Staphylococcus simulans]
MKKSQARGYLLEDVLEKLIEINGYEIITEDEDGVIERRYNGLNVVGRGGYHQVDSLGRLRYELPFIYQIRLFVEAKYNSKKIGIDTVRQGIGLLSDINSSYKTVNIENDTLKVPLHNYNYVIFSASGFTKEARLLALAHKIYLVDLNDEDYKGLKEFIEVIVDELSCVCAKNNGDIPNEQFEELRESIRNDLEGKESFFKIFFKLINEIELNNLMVKRSISIKLITVLYKFFKFKKYLQNKSIYFASDQYGQNHCILSHDDKMFRQYLLNDSHTKVRMIVEEMSKSLNNNYKKQEYYRTELYLRNHEKNSSDPLLSFTISKYGIVNPVEQKSLVLSFIAYLDEKNPTLCTLETNNIID